MDGRKGSMVAGLAGSGRKGNRQRTNGKWKQQAGRQSKYSAAGVHMGKPGIKECQAHAGPQAQQHQRW